MERARLETWREALLLEAVSADVTGGSWERALADLPGLVDAHPLREDLWEWLVVLTARRDGPDAGLAVHARAVRMLDRLLGAGPGPSLQAARRRVEAGQA